MRRYFLIRKKIRQPNINSPRALYLRSCVSSLALYVATARSSDLMRALGEGCCCLIHTEFRTRSFSIVLHAKWTYIGSLAYTARLSACFMARRLARARSKEKVGHQGGVIEKNFSFYLVDMRPFCLGQNAYIGTQRDSLAFFHYTITQLGFFTFQKFAALPLKIAVKCPERH